MERMLGGGFERGETAREGVCVSLCVCVGAATTGVCGWLVTSALASSALENRLRRIAQGSLTAAAAAAHRPVWHPRVAPSPR